MNGQIGAGLAESTNRDGAFPRLDEDQQARLRKLGRLRKVEPGEVLFAAGDVGTDLFVKRRHGDKAAPWSSPAAPSIVRLDVARLDEFEGGGVYYPATQAEGIVCAGDPVVIVGAGNSAGQAAMSLYQRASESRLLTAVSLCPWRPVAPGSSPSATFIQARSNGSPPPSARARWPCY